MQAHHIDPSTGEDELAMADASLVPAMAGRRNEPGSATQSERSDELGQGWTQRSLPVRIRQEIQTLSRQIRAEAAPLCSKRRACPAFSLRQSAVVGARRASLPAKSGGRPAALERVAIEPEPARACLRCRHRTASMGLRPSAAAWVYCQRPPAAASASQLAPPPSAAPAGLGLRRRCRCDAGLC